MQTVNTYSGFQTEYEAQIFTFIQRRIPNTRNVSNFSQKKLFGPLGPLEYSNRYSLQSTIGLILVSLPLCCQPMIGRVLTIIIIKRKCMCEIRFFLVQRKLREIELVSLVKTEHIYVYVYMCIHNSPIKIIYFIHIYSYSPLCNR